MNYSKDYHKLKQLLDSGQTVFGTGNRLDLSRKGVHWRKEQERGYQYYLAGGWDLFGEEITDEVFIEFCQKFNIQFLDPDHQEPVWIYPEEGKPETFPEMGQNINYYWDTIPTTGNPRPVQGVWLFDSKDSKLAAERGLLICWYAAPAFPGYQKGGEK